MSDESNKQRRKRSTNFSQCEIRQLVDLVLEYQEILENKTSNADTWVEKKDAWVEIEKKFNAMNGHDIRTAESLRSKYETMKKELRRKSANKKLTMLEAGGGDDNIPDYLDYEKKLLKIICTSVENSPSAGDCDSGVPSIFDSLKARKISIRHVKRRPSLSAQDRFSKTTEAKNEQLQHDVQKADADYKCKEHDMKIQLLQAELDLTIQQKLNEQVIHQKKLELLNKQIIEQNLKNELLQIELQKLK